MNAQFHALALGAAWSAVTFAAEPVELQLRVDDAEGRSIPCRIHLSGPDDKPVAPPGLPFWRDHFVCDGRTTLSLAPGKYKYAIERGPEFERLTGDLQVESGKSKVHRARLNRVADLKKQGWYGGDLHVHRPIDDIELLMRAEDLHVAPVITWWNQRNVWTMKERPKGLVRRFDGDRFYHVMAGEDERGGGALLYFHLDTPLEFGKPAREAPSSLAFARTARDRAKGVWIDAEKPFWWDFPAWLAAGIVDSVGIAHNHMHRSGVMGNEAWGRARDEKAFPGTLGNGRWTQQIYYHALNCGFRLTPSAGSASGVLPNPVGHNRVYVHVDGEFTYEKWWAGLKAGRCFVTNGPLLRVTADGKLAGHAFKVDKERPVEIDLAIDITSNDRVKTIEIIQNGTVVESLSVPEGKTNRASTKLKINRPGWFLIRVVADRSDTYRFASTAPYYVESNEIRHVSRKSIMFFREWQAERLAKLEKDVPAGIGREEVINTHKKALEFWDELSKKANAD